MRPFRTWTDGEGTTVAQGYSDGRRHAVRVPGLARFEFDSSDETVRAFPEVSLDAATLEAAFRRCALPLLLHARGWEGLHASAVTTSGGVAAFCAPSGHGKSTIAVAPALADAGFEAFCDDSVIVARQSSRWWALSDGAGAPILPDLHTRQRLDRALPLGAIFLLERLASSSRASVEAVPLHPARALPRVVQHAHAFRLDDPGRMQRMAAAYLDLIATVPVFELRFPARLDVLPAIASAVRHAVSTLPAIAPATPPASR